MISILWGILVRDLSTPVWGIEGALEATGFLAHNRVNCGPGSIGTGALLDDLRRLGSELGRPPKSTDIEDRSKFSVPTYYNYFDNLADAISQAGFPIIWSGALAQFPSRLIGFTNPHRRTAVVD